MNCDTTERQGPENPTQHHHGTELNSLPAAPKETGTIRPGSEGKGLKLSKEPPGLTPLRKNSSKRNIPYWLWVTPPLILGILVRMFSLAQRVPVDKETGQ